jgi:hypothetical protein
MSDTAVVVLGLVVVALIALAGWLAYLRRDSGDRAYIKLALATLRSEFDAYKIALDQRFEGTAQAMLTSVDLLRREGDERLVKLGEAGLGAVNRDFHPTGKRFTAKLGRA